LFGPDREAAGRPALNRWGTVSPYDPSGRSDGRPDRPVSALRRRGVTAL